MPLNFFKDSADTGTAFPSSIQPYDDGEPGSSKILNRPTQNLRNRSEVIRKACDFQDLLSRSDRGLVLASDVAAHIWFQEYTDGGYAFRLSSTGGWSNWDRDLVFFPLISPATLPEENPTTPILTKYVFDDGNDGVFAIYPQVNGVNRKVAHGASNLYVEIFKVTGENPPTPIVTVEGSLRPYVPNPEFGPTTIRIQIADNNTSTISQAVLSINSHPAALQIVTAEVISGGERTISTTVSRQKFYGSAESFGGVDDESFRVTGEQLKTYFDDHLSHRLQDGSFLVLDFKSARERLGQTLDDNSLPVLRTIHASESPGDTRNVGDCTGTVPICKMLTVDGTPMLAFFNGRTFPENSDERFMDSLAEELMLGYELAQSDGYPHGDYMVGADDKAAELLDLTKGTINSQLKTLIKYGSLQTSEGANLLYGAEIVDSKFPIALGSFREQLQDFLGHLTDSVEAGGDFGASRIGAAAYSSLPVGYVSTQLRYCWDRLIDHSDHAPDAMDQHKLNAINTRPFVLVSQTSGEGYSTIAAALAAIQAAGTGGTIYIFGGTYTEAISLSGCTIDKPIEFVGFGNVVWENSATYCLQLEATCILQAKISFRNIRFSSSGGTYAVVFATSASHPQALVEFKNCRFQSSTHQSYILNQSSPNRSLVYDCVLANTGAGTNTNAVVYLTDGSVSVEGCKFVYAGAIVYANGTGLKNVEVVGNEFVKCGYASGYGNIQALIYVNGGVNTLARVVGNSYPTYTRSSEFAKFCRLTTCGGAIVSGNTMDIGTITYTAVSDQFVIQFSGPTSSTGWCRITNNRFTTLGSLSPLGVSCGSALIVGNSFSGVRHQYNGSSIGVITNKAAYSLVRNNQVITDALATYQLYRGIVANDAAVSAGIFSGNILDGVSNSVGILCRDTSYLILRNFIRGMDSSANAPSGIGASSGANLVVHGNTVLNCLIGADLGSTVKSVARGNLVIPYDNAGLSTTGLTVGQDSVVSGNKVKFNTQTVRTALLLQQSGAICLGNYGYKPIYGISGNVTDLVASGNEMYPSRFGLYSTGLQRSVFRGNFSYGSSDSNATGVHFTCDNPTQDLVIAGNNFHNIYRGAYFTSGSSETNMAKFLALVDNISQVVGASTDNGIQFTTGVTPNNKRFSAISGNVISKLTHTTTAGNYGILCSGDKVAMWENIVRIGSSASDRYFYTYGYGGAVGGLGLGKDQSSPNYNDWNCVGDENYPQVAGGAERAKLCTIDVNFNRQMGTGRTTNGNYTVTHGATSWTVQGVAIDQENPTHVTLTMENKVPPPDDDDDVTIVAGTGISDAIGNPMSTSNNTYQITSARSYPKAYPIGAGTVDQQPLLRTLRVAFDRVMSGTNLLDSNRYSVTHGGSSWTIVGVSKATDTPRTAVDITCELLSPPPANSEALVVTGVAGTNITNSLQDTNENPLQTYTTVDHTWTGTYGTNPILLSVTQQPLLRSFVLTFNHDMSMSGGIFTPSNYYVDHGIIGGWDIFNIVQYGGSPNQILVACYELTDPSYLLDGVLIEVTSYPSATIVDTHGNPNASKNLSFLGGTYPVMSEAGVYSYVDNKLYVNYSVQMDSTAWIYTNYAVHVDIYEDPKDPSPIGHYDATITGASCYQLNPTITHLVLSSALQSPTWYLFYTVTATWANVYDSYGNPLRVYQKTFWVEPG